MRDRNVPTLADPQTDINRVLGKNVNVERQAFE